MFLRETVIKEKGKEYRYWRIVKTYWDKKQKKVRHKTVVQLGKLKPEELSFLRVAISGKPGERFCWDSLQVNKCLDYLGVAILDRIWRYWELDRLISGELGKVMETLCINRCLEPSSDYHVIRWYETTILPRILQVELNPTLIYRSLDEAYEIEDRIQEHLYTKIKQMGLDDYSLIFYDLTSSYFEESSCSLAKYGLSRDHRRDKKQIIIALAVSKRGFPFYWRVLEGNTADSKTVKGLIDELKNRFKVGRTCLVMDKGLANQENINKIEKEKLLYLVTLRRDRIRKIKGMPCNYLMTINEENLESKLGYFIYHSRRAYYKEIGEIEGKRYILCFNPEKFVQERKDRQDKIESIKEYLDGRNNELQGAKNRRNREILRGQIERYLNHRKAGRLFKFRLMEYEGGILQIRYNLREDKIKEYGLLDGVYVLMTNLNQKRLGEYLVSVEDLINGYRSRMRIERGFRYLKSFVEIRPIYHQREERIKAHILICILGYLLSNTVEHLVRRKKGFEDLTADAVYGYLRSCRLVELQAGKEKRIKITSPDDNQINLVNVLADNKLLEEDNLQRYL